MSTLTDTEKRFIDGALKEKAPLLFIVQHIHTCRKLKIEPDMEELLKLDIEINDFILDT